MIWHMEPTVRAAVDEWHASVNTGAPERAARAVGDPVVVVGPKGAGSITPARFAEWVERSGIRLVPLAWHQVGDRLAVVEQDATWPGSSEPTRVATVFRVSEGRVTAVLRSPDLAAALDLARICHEMAATA